MRRCIHNTRALRRLHQGHKNSGICKQNPQIFTTLPVLCKAQYINILKTKTGNVGTKNAIVTILIFIPGVELLLPIISNL